MRLSMRELRERFPLHVRDKSLYRSIKSLERLGYIHVDRSKKVVSLVERPEYAEELARARESVHMVAAIARAWGVPVPKPGEKIPDRPPDLRQGGGGVSEVG